jgi:hypothetical protein
MTDGDRFWEAKLFEGGECLLYRRVMVRDVAPVICQHSFGWIAGPEASAGQSETFDGPLGEQCLGPIPKLVEGELQGGGAAVQTENGAARRHASSPPI